MKFVKNLAAFLAAMLTLGLCAFADEPVSVLYNGNELKFTDVSPVIIEGRTLLPFRSVFEQMGAKVDYDEATRTAVADFGGNEISFSLDGKEIYSSASDEPVYIMDVPPTIVDGRTLVPVRAVSEAGGLAVGWDSAERTVNVVDKDAIAAVIAEKAPVVKSFKALFENPAKVYTQSEKISLAGQEFSANAEAKVNSDGENREVIAQISLTAQGVSVDNISLDFIINDEAAYIKTDLMEKLAASMPDEADLKIMSTFFSADRWFKADLSELETMLAGEDRGVLKKAVSSGGADEIIDEYLGLISQSVVDSLDINSANEIKMIPQMTERLAGDVAELLEVSVDSDSAKVRLSLPVIDVETESVLYTNYFNAEFSQGVAVKADLSMKTDELEIKAQAEGSVGGLVEKVLVPAEYVNLVDILYSLSL